MKRLVWTKKEKNDVVRRAAELRSDDPTLTSLDALYRAQGDVIEQHRRKPQIPYALEKKLQQRVQDHPPIPRAAPPAPPPAPPKSPQEVLQEVFAPLLAPLGAVLGTTIAERLAVAFAPVIEQAVEKAVLHAHGVVKLNGTPIAIGKPADVAAAQHAGRKRVVVVIGPNGDQRRELERRFPEVDFHFAKNDEGAERVEAMAKGAWLTVGMAKFIRHTAEKRVKSLPSYVRVNGAVSSIETVIRGRMSAEAPIQLPS